MNDISKEQVWALRGAASREAYIGTLAVVSLCDNLLAAWKERDEAQQNLENIKASRGKDKCDGCKVVEIIGDMRGILNTPLGFDVRDHMREVLEDAGIVGGVATQVLEAVRKAAGCPMGRSLTDFVAVMRNSANRATDEKLEARQILDATDDETLVDAAKRVAEEAEGLYRFKCRIREALGVEKGVDMAEAIRKLKAEPRVGVNVRTLITERIRDCLYDLCEDAGIDWPGEMLGGTEPVRHAIVAAIKNGEGSDHNDPAMRQNLAEKTAALELAGKRIQELESTIREHEKDLKVLDELQDEQTKLVSMLMRMAEGKSGPQIVVEWPIIRDHRTGVNRMGIPVVTSPNVPRNTWGWLICSGKAKA